jgi:hypothetical protein
MKEVHEIHECIPRDTGLLAEPQRLAERAIEHPRGDLAVGSAIVLVELAPKHGPALAHHLYPHDDLLVVKRMPRVEDAPQVGLLGILVGSCTTTSGVTRSAAT